ncbi:motility associated factor glycosyltransferase family protein [Campylobacter jejuni]|uniref:motility associated factor glycosyltransferase family protein n=1 Tax=Campylobacter jejuni TaxID=197 RepID=UPI000F7FDC74|nr:motility associated factor glycosyltransferase family protein [Campylobacter jejuni]RTJ64099.1 PseE protein [Campylobacter jejuni]
MNQTEIFKKNLENLKGQENLKLKEKLEKFKKLEKFNYKFNSDPLDINIIDLKNKKNIYENPLKELHSKLEEFNQTYLRYPVVFFYGLGNGVFYKAISQNEAHKRIIIFEPELEIIFMVFHWIDFSEDLKKGRMIIIHSEEVSSTKSDKLFSILDKERIFKTYNLQIHTHFYAKYKKEIRNINDNNLKAMQRIALTHGTSPKDAMKGIVNFVTNIPKMLTHPEFINLLKKRYKKSKNAIIVSTGPSLKKQLPILKNYINKATIFCADSAYPILAKEGIKPDYVLCLERDEENSAFFNNDFQEFDKDILFVFASLVHPLTIKYSEENRKNYLLFSRTSYFALNLGLHKFGYLGGGMSVAHTSYELATQLGHENIILIGQDLAYSKEGKSHAEDFLYAIDEEKNYIDDKGNYQILSYGGKGLVESSRVWVLFKQIFESYIYDNKEHIKTYNCTEGGARIEGSIEKPFKEVCEELLTKDLKKPFSKLKAPKRKESYELMLQAYTNIKKGMKRGEGVVKECQKILRKMQNVIRGNQKYTLDEINLELDKIKKKIESKNFQFFLEILSPQLYHQELQLAPLYVKNFKDEGDKQNKLLAWIFAHEAWLEDIIDLIDAQNKNLKNAIIPLQDILEKKNLI